MSTLIHPKRFLWVRTLCRPIKLIHTKLCGAISELFSLSVMTHQLWNKCTPIFEALATILKFKGKTTLGGCISLTCFLPEPPQPRPPHSLSFSLAPHSSHASHGSTRTIQISYHSAFSANYCLVTVLITGP